MWAMARLKVSLILDSGARIGPGKAALLESVRDTGSISAAARAMGMDYKRAWTLIDSLNRAFDTPVVERATGGAGGGGARLTPFGTDVLARYLRLEAAAAKLGAGDLKALEQHGLPDAGPKV
jgi:molybdate transport system regulatory protein